MTEKDLLIKEYLRVKKEAIYSRIIFLLTAVTGARKSDFSLDMLMLIFKIFLINLTSLKKVLN